MVSRSTRHIVVAASLIVAFSIFAGSCASFFGQSGGNSSNPYAFVKSLKLEPGEVYFKDMIEAKNGVYPANAFSAATNILAMDDFLMLTSVMKPEQQLALARALFDKLPVRKDAGDLRIVVVGDFYSEDRDLVILIDQVSLRAGAVPGRTMGIRFLTNASRFRGEDKQTGKIRLLSMGDNLSSETNYAPLTVNFPNGDFVRANNLTIKPTDIATAKSDADLANLMDTYAKDEFPENDALIDTINTQLTEKKNLDPVISILTKLNYGMYLIKQEKYADAEVLWRGLSTQIPAGTDPSISAAVSDEAPTLLRIARDFFPAAGN